MARILATAAVLVALALPAPVAGVKGDDFAGYTFGSDVGEHLKLDLDQKEMESTTDAGQWSAAQRIYSSGKNSDKGGALRTLAGFSTSAAEKMKGEPFFELFQRYYNRPDYADRFISNALDGTAEFAGKSDIFRAEVANKGSQYSSVWMYVLHELEDAVDDCNAGTLTDNADRVKAWDEGWAFYTGSLIGPDGEGEGVMPFTLAQKRCSGFQTCDTRAKAPVNNEILRIMTAGKADIEGKLCDAALKKKNEIARLMAVPVMQGLLRYVLQAEEKGPTQPKAHAEGLAFARGILPWINHCDSGTAKKVVENFQARADPPMKDGKEDVAKALYKVLGCMGISCDLVGNHPDLPKCETSGAVEKVPGEDIAAATNKGSKLFSKAVSGQDPVTAGFGSEPSRRRPASDGSSNNSGGGLSTGGKVGVGIGSVVAIAVVGFVLFKFFGKKKKVMQPVSPFEEGSSAV